MKTNYIHSHTIFGLCFHFVSFASTPLRRRRRPSSLSRRKTHFPFSRERVCCACIQILRVVIQQTSSSPAWKTCRRAIIPLPQLSLSPTKFRSGRRTEQNKQFLSLSFSLSPASHTYRVFSFDLLHLIPLPLSLPSKFYVVASFSFWISTVCVPCVSFVGARNAHGINTADAIII